MNLLTSGISELPRFDFSMPAEAYPGGLRTEALTAMASAYVHGAVILEGSADAEAALLTAAEKELGHIEGDGGAQRVDHFEIPGASPGTIVLQRLLQHYRAGISHQSWVWRDAVGLTDKPHKDRQWEHVGSKIRGRKKVNHGLTLLTNLSHQGEFRVHENSRQPTGSKDSYFEHLPIVGSGTYAAGDSVLLRQDFPTMPATVHSAVTSKVEADTEHVEDRYILSGDHLAETPDHLRKLEEELLMHYIMTYKFDDPAFQRLAEFKLSAHSEH